jgi:TIR domain-containing protein
MAESPSAPQRAIEVFLSYAHPDEALHDELVAHLSILVRQGIIAGWHDRRIPVGREWAGDIDAHLATAHIILLLVSADFLASDYCYDIEMQKVMTLHYTGEAFVIPVIMRPVDWHDAPFGQLQALPQNGRPVTTWPNRDEAFLAIARGIRDVAMGIGELPAVAHPRADGSSAPLQLPLSLPVRYWRVVLFVVGTLSIAYLVRGPAHETLGSISSYVSGLLEHLGILVRRISSRELIFTGAILCVIGGLAFGTRQILELIAAWQIVKRIRNLERR